MIFSRLLVGDLGPVQALISSPRDKDEKGKAEREDRAENCSHKFSFSMRSFDGLMEEILAGDFPKNQTPKRPSDKFSDGDEQNVRSFPAGKEGTFPLCSEHFQTITFATAFSRHSVTKPFLIFVEILSLIFHSSKFAKKSHIHFVKLNPGIKTLQIIRSRSQKSTLVEKTEIFFHKAQKALLVPSTVRAKLY